MIKRTITYKDFDGNERTEDLYFNLTQLEATEIAMDMPNDLMEEVSNVETNEEVLKAGERLIKKMGGKGIFEFVKTLVLKSYGIKSEDGRTFKKSEKLSEEFSQTVAYSTFMMELLTDEEATSAFINGVIPSELANGMIKSLTTSK